MPILTGNELCATLRISKSTLNRLKKAGLPSIGRRRLARFDLDLTIKWYDGFSTRTQVPEMLPVGDYECRVCGYEAIIEMPMTPGPCPKCGTRQIPIRVDVPAV